SPMAVADPSDVFPSSTDSGKSSTMHDPTQFSVKVRRRAQETVATQTAFFEAHADAITHCASVLDEAFAAGGRLFSFGCGGSAADAQHVAVEFAHPVFERRRALPAIALPNDVAHITALGNDRDFSTAF